MAKSTHSQEILTGTSESFTEAEQADLVVISRYQMGGAPSAGNSSSQSSEREQSEEDSQRDSLRDPAPTTESPSSPTTEDSSVPSTDGDGQTTETESVEDEEIPPYEEWDYRDLQAECRERSLSAGGKHEELVFRLMEFDEEHPSDAETGD